MTQAAPGDLTGGAVLIYDGDCGFCQRSLDVLRRRLVFWPRAEPYQALSLEQLGVSLQDAVEAMLWVEPGMPTLAGAAAFARLFQEQPQLGWRMVGRTMELPGIRYLAAVVYEAVARHRHRLPGGTGACRIPSS